MRVTVSHEFLPKTSTVRTSRVMDDFGIDFEQGRHVIADDLEVDVRPGDVVAFTGASGSGKSSLLRAVVSQLSESAAVIDLDDIELADRPLIDALPGSVDDAMRLLSQCGLGEAHLMLRTPAELSEGQRYRFRLAMAMAERPDWIVADEFSATLDRTLARVVSYGLRRHAMSGSTVSSNGLDGSGCRVVNGACTQHGSQNRGTILREAGVDRGAKCSTGFLIATTHEDVLEDLAPDVHVCCELDGGVEVVRNDRKKKDAARSATNSGSVKRPVAIGRTSLGGITGRTISV